MLHNKKIDLLWKNIRGLFLSYFEALTRLQRREIIAVINLVPAVQRSIITGINVTIYLGGFSQIRKKEYNSRESHYAEKQSRMATLASGINCTKRHCYEHCTVIAVYIASK